MAKDQLTFDDTDESLKRQSAWEQALNRLSEQIHENHFETYIKKLSLVSVEGGVATFHVPGDFIRTWIEDRYVGPVAKALGDELGETVTIRVIAQPRPKVSTRAVAEIAVAAPTPAASKLPEDLRFKPNDRYTFDAFVTGQSNRFAFAGAKAVAEAPGLRYNPLFIYGQSGLGKTHLLHAIANEILRKNPSAALMYITAQQFAEEFVSALQNNRVSSFRETYKKVQIWLVDDIQFIAHKDKTQEEVFYAFNHLYSTRRQIVLTSDRPPRDLSVMDERLKTRFEAGLVADIQMPDTETRCAILQSKATHERIDVSTDVAMFLAENVPGNIRVLEGALTSIAAQSSVAGATLDVEFAQRFVETYYRTARLETPAFEDIVSHVGNHFKISNEEILGTSRKAPIVHARHIAIYITREITKNSWKHIGTLFGDRDHTSMMHAHEKISEMAHRDRDLRATVKMLTRNLYPDR